jgi:hypothetical protein
MDKRGDFGPVLFLIVVTSLFLLVLALVLVPLLRNSGIFNNFFGSKLKFTDYYCDVAAKKLSEEKKVEYTFALVKDSAECRAVAVKANQKDFDSFTTRDTASTGYLCCIYTGSSVTRTASAAGTGTGSGTSAAGAGTGVGTATSESSAEKNTCNNNIKDGDEIDIDCGGSCKEECKCVCGNEKLNYYHYDELRVLSPEIFSFEFLNGKWNVKRGEQGDMEINIYTVNIHTGDENLDELIKEFKMARTKNSGIEAFKEKCYGYITGVCS